MAKFSDLHPNAGAGFSFGFEGSELYHADKFKQCWHCKQYTRWLDINFGAYLCSEECFRVKWAEYASVSSRQDPTSPGISFISLFESKNIKVRYQYIRFVPKPDRTIVCMNHASDLLGRISYYQPWKEYIFDPGVHAHSSVIFSRGCLLDIAHFLEQVNSAKLPH